MERSLALMAGVLLLGPMAMMAQQRPAQMKSIPDSINYIWKVAERQFVALADAMPEDKWGFKPTQGAFSKARTFGEQVKHVACANEAWAKKLRGETPPERCDTGGPNPAKTKAEIMAYLRESFAMMDAGIKATNAQNLLAPVQGPYAGGNRLEVLNSALWHLSDHYGQLIIYLRMNGLEPPGN